MRIRSLHPMVLLAGIALALLGAPIVFGHISIAPTESTFGAREKLSQPSAAVPPDAQSDAALIERGKDRFKAYRCYECHGMNGEGTDDAPDLIHTRLDADGISKFLQNPSADAVGKGMPDIPATSPDLQPLVAFVVSLKQP